MNVDDHPWFVDVRDFELGQFRSAHTGSARWAGAVFLGKWNVLQHVVAPERLHEEEAKSRHSLANALEESFLSRNRWT